MTDHPPTPSKKRPQAAAVSASPSESPAAKRSKPATGGTASASHLPSCTDRAACRGCDQGEIEIHISGVDGASGKNALAAMSAADLYRMALEERDQEVLNGSSLSEDKTNGNDDAETKKKEEDADGDREEVDHADPEVRRKAVTRLFEMAIDAFVAQTGLVKETLAERGGAGAGAGADAATTPSASATKTPTSAELASKFMFASCLLDFGSYVPVPAYIERSAEIYAECIEFLESETGRAFQSSWGASAAQFGLGRAQMELLRCRYESEEADDDDDDEEEESDEEVSDKPETFEAKAANKKELEMVRIATTAIAKGLESVKSDKDAYVLQCITAARLFRDYAVLQRNRRGHGNPHASKNFRKSFETAQKYLSSAESQYPNSVSFDTEALAIRGSCLFYMAEHLTAGKGSDDNVATIIKDLTEAETCFRTAIEKAEKSAASGGPKDPHVVQNLHLLGQALLLHSSIDPDETVTVTLFDEAVSCLRKAFELDPDNEEVEEQLEQMGILDEEDNNESEDLGSESEGDMSED
ncbi:hypothetical protein HDU87_008409 [Geranomyces variabilis]|uniref:Uncharacterized protein n=1 Tax=Geranomyces variabilis TaxID=109894 RepID=A0AAD5TF70_9FUNG|nr:hypothetical protein HDU87_008409 [Geranomyces variabilis]